MSTPTRGSLLNDGSASTRSEEVMFVRSQSQLALDNPAAKGFRLTRDQVERAFGSTLIERVLEDGVVSLVPTYHEPARTLRARREHLGLAVEALARAAHLPLNLVVDAETPGKIVSIQSLNELCQVLALDESVLGHMPTAGGDAALGVRLRMLTENRDEKSFSAPSVAKLAEAAWVVAKQASLAEALNRRAHFLVSSESPKDANYSFPTFEKGYLLAEKTRRLLGLDDEEPIISVRALVEEALNVPLIHTSLESRFAGATIANGRYRGIVVNERGRNSDVAVRRMTMCHELAHLLWDPDEKLDRLLVDEYDSIEGSKAPTDVVEMRANSFAVAFLVPINGMKRIVGNAISTKEAIEQVSLVYGVSISAARYHIANVCNLDTKSVAVDDVDLRAWIPSENLTIDFMPGLEDGTPISRRGMFSGVVARAFLDKIISPDTAKMCFKLDGGFGPDQAKAIAGMWGL